MWSSPLEAAAGLLPGALQPERTLAVQTKIGSLVPKPNNIVAGRMATPAQVPREYNYPEGGTLLQNLICGFAALALCAGGLLAQNAGSVVAQTAARVDFQREIRPILSDNCFQCHGPDSAARQAGLRLDRRESALGKAIVPGKSADSLLYQRISDPDPNLRMPPADSHKHVTPAQIALLKRWIDAGAPWKEHWAFQPPVKPKPPAVHDAAWVRNPIDRFILAKLEEKGLAPAPAEDRRALIRRVALDTTGLPPKPAEVETFLQDTSANAYERMVDRYLASPHYGEHRARYWLDAARYGDTHGIHVDNYREIWPYRDWVIAAFNRNLSFDQFTIEQLAGDLLPNATLDQRIATGFQRCNVTTNEVGHHRRRVRRDLRQGSRRYRGRRLARYDRRLRHLPRPQVRPHLAEGFLRARRLLPQHHAESHGRQHLRHAAHPARAARRRPRRVGTEERAPCRISRQRWTGAQPSRRRGLRAVAPRASTPNPRRSRWKTAEDAFTADLAQPSQFDKADGQTIAKVPRPTPRSPSPSASASVSAKKDQKLLYHRRASRIRAIATAAGCVDIAARQIGFRLIGDNGAAIEARAADADLLKPGTWNTSSPPTMARAISPASMLYLNGRPLADAGLRRAQREV